MATKKKEKEPKILQKCTMCGEEKEISKNYYKSYSELFKNNYEQRMCICKDCVVKLFDNYKIKFSSDIKALYETCKLLDIYYSNDLYEAALKQSETKNSNVIQIYFQKSSSLPQYRDKVFLDSDSFDTESENKKINENLNRDVISFWGTGLSENDYAYLEDEYGNLCSRFECESYSQEMLFQEIAFQRLDIKKKRQQGSSVDKELKTLQDLLGSANIKPVQENASMASEQVTFGTLIKKYENEMPVPEPLDDWKKADWIRKYVVVWFLGHLCRMMGVNNPYEDEYLEELEEYTVRMENESGDE